MSRKKKKEEKQERLAIKDFFDRVLPGVLKFYSDHYICGDSYRCVWAIKEYPPSTEEQAILRQLADRTMSPYGSTTGWWTMRNSTGSSKTPTGATGFASAGMTSKRWWTRSII